ncbi:MAG: hypothetical protein GY811_15910 [Myxococcales bacterium]|nr:hypothetical protein [Myxococcales bacterium]
MPLERFRTALASPRAEKRLDALISGDDAEEKVQALAVTDLYHLIAEVGLGDSVELLSLCSAEQIQGCVDMEIWDRDLPSLEAFMPWLAALQENGFEFFGKAWVGLDAELTALTLARLCIIYDKTLGEEIPDDEDREVFDTPDTFFQVVITAEDDVQRKLLYTIIEDLYRYDLTEARMTLMAARAEPKAHLEEMSYRWRSCRMADLGYVDFYEALEVFRPIDPASVQVGEGTAEFSNSANIPGELPIASDLPSPMVQPIMGRGFFAKALEALEDDAEIEAMQGALLYLVNRVLAAGSLSPGNAEALELATLHATSTAALGLEYLSGGDQERAIEALRSVSLTRLHRVGYSLCLRLARFARMLAPRAMSADSDTQLLLEAVLSKRPFFPESLSETGATSMRPIESRADLQAIADSLKSLALRIAIADALGVDLAALAAHPEPRPGLDDFARTALLRAAGGKVASAAPLQQSELDAFRDQVSVAGLSAGDRETASMALVSLLDEAGVVEARDSLETLINTWLGELSESFADLDNETSVESRFLSGLVFATGMA